MDLQVVFVPHRKSVNEFGQRLVAVLELSTGIPKTTQNIREEESIMEGGVI